MVAKLEQEFGGGGEVKGPKFWCLRVRWSPFFPGFKTEDCCLPVSASGNPTRGDKVREGCCNLSPSIKASLLCTQACNISVCILETSEYFAQSCREGYKHLGNPQPPHPLPNTTISSVACGAPTCLSGRKNTHAGKWTDPNLLKHSHSVHLSDPKSSTWSVSVTSVLTNRERCLD